MTERKHKYKIAFLMILILFVTNCTSNINSNKLEQNSRDKEIEKIQKVIDANIEMKSAIRQKVSYNRKTKEWEFLYSFGVKDGDFCVFIKSEKAKEFFVVYSFSEARIRYKVIR